MTLDMNRSGERGSAMLIGLAVFAALGGGLMFYMKSMGKQNKDIGSLRSHNESHVSVEKLRTLGSFLVSSNTVICKQGPFTGQTEGYRCKWTGKQLYEGSLVNVDLAKLGLSNEHYDKEGFLSFDIDSQKMNSEGQADVNLKGRMGFKLYDAEKDQLKIAAKLGAIPVESLLSDNDKAVVLIKVEVSYSNAESAGSSAKPTEVKEFFSTRRPIAIPKMTINQANCKKSCETSVTVNDNPSCRGDQNFENSPEVLLNAYTENLGPGVLYEFRVLKEITLDKTIFPNTANPPSQQVNGMPGRDYLLPGEKVAWADSMTCLEAKRTQNIFVRRGKCYTDSGFSKEVTCANDSNNQHFVNAGSVSFKADISPYKASTFIGFKKELNRLFPEGVPLNYQIPNQYKSTPQAIIEPARTVNAIITSGDFPTKMETTTRFIVIPTH